MVASNKELLRKEIIRKERLSKLNQELALGLVSDEKLSKEHEATWNKAQQALGDRVYTELMHTLVQHYFLPKEAKKYWFGAVRHRKEMAARLGYDPGFFVALTDYLFNKEGVVNRAILLPGAKYEAIVDLALRDGLTGVFDREAIQHKLEVGLGDRKPLVIAMIDIDGLSKLNSRIGHVKADRAIAGLAALLKQATTGQQKIGRYGGDEFIVLLPGLDEGLATTWADKVRRAVERKFRKLGLTVSIGLAVRKENSDALTLIRQADQALLKAKNAGKNQWAFSIPKI